MTREELKLLKEIQALEFTVLEFALYLDTHLDDQAALEEYNDYAQQLREARMEYQDRYGPLHIMHPSDYPWEYPESPWPWQIEY